MNILIINHYAGSRKHGFEYRPFYLGKEFLKKGNNVSIIASSFSHLRLNNPLIKENIFEENIDGIKYYWIKTPFYSGNSIKRVMNIFLFIYNIYRYKRKLKIKINPDIVIASSTYPLDIFPAFKIAQMNKAKLIFEVHDLWPLTPIELGGMSRNNPFIKLLQIAEDFAYQKADKVISILPKAKEYMIQHGMKPEKFTFIPNGIDFSEWNNATQIPENHLSLITKLREEGKFLVGYSGAIGLANALEFLIAAADILKEKPIVFLIVGDGPEKKCLLNKAQELKNVFFLSYINKTSIPNFLKIMDILYLGFRHKSIYKFGVGTNKLYEYMMSGRPIVQSQKAGNDLVKENNCGISVLPENPKLIADAIINLYNLSEEERQKLGNNGREYVLKNHDYALLAEKFINAVK